MLPPDVLRQLNEAQARLDAVYQAHPDIEMRPGMPGTVATTFTYYDVRPNAMSDLTLKLNTQWEQEKLDLLAQLEAAQQNPELATAQAALTQAQADLLSEQNAHAVTRSLLAERSALEETESAGKLAAIRTAWVPFGDAAAWLRTGPPSPMGPKLFDYLDASGANKVITRQQLIDLDTLVK